MRDTNLLRRVGSSLTRQIALWMALLLALGMISKQTQAQTFKTLYTFTGGADGGDPGGILRDPQGNLYGYTFAGGIKNLQNLWGVLFKLDTGGNYQVLHTFSGEADGGTPSALMQDAQGNLFGTTVYGGSSSGFNGNGVLFELDATGNYQVLHNFSGGTGGAHPSNSIFRNGQGNLFGATLSGGQGNGAIYEFDATGNYQVLYSFMGGADGKYPEGISAQDGQGNLYGTTEGGGSGNNGVIFKLDPMGNFTVLHTFDGSDGDLGFEPLILDTQGNLFGTTFAGGPGGWGEVYQLDPAGNLSILQGFDVKADGGHPFSGLIQDPQGNFYGTTWLGGGFYQQNMGFGEIYQIDTSRRLHVLYSFTGGSDGTEPGLLVRDAQGNLYGTASAAGADGAGTIFALLNTTGSALTSLTASNASGAVGQTVPLQATLLDAGTNAPISGDTLAFSVNGVFVGSAITDSNGNATFQYPIAEGGAGNRTISVYFSGDSQYASNTGLATLTVSKSNTATAVADATGAGGQTVALSARLTRNTDNSGVIGRTVGFAIDGMSVGSAITDSNGNAVLNDTLPAGIALGNHTISATFDGDGDYNASSGNGTLIVKIGTTIAARPVKGSIGETTSLIAVLKRADTNRPLSGEMVRFLVDGNGIGGPVLTNNAGVAMQNFFVSESLGTGNHTVTAVFAGDSNYNASTGNSTLSVALGRVRITVPDVSGPAGSNVLLKATLTNRSGAVLKGRLLKFKVDGKILGSVMTNAGGQAMINYTIPSGLSSGTTLKIEVLFRGDTLYRRGKGQGALTVQ